MASGFKFVLANHEFYSRLASWRVVIRTPVYYCIILLHCPSFIDSSVGLYCTLFKQFSLWLFFPTVAAGHTIDKKKNNNKNNNNNNNNNN
jgi:hypothetical protein